MRLPQFPALSSMERLVLLVITAVSQTWGEGCTDVGGDTSRCLHQYQSQVDSLRTSGQTFYTGVDVETIRMICRSLRESAFCVHNLKEGCPDTESSDIEVLLSEHLSIAEMCHHPNFLELYARNQFCFMKLGASSEKCYQSFRAQAESETTKIYTGDQSSLINYCRHLETFIECIRANVRINCQGEAASLVEILVRPSVSMSEHCRNETTTTTTATPTTKSSRKKGNSGSYAESKSVNSSIQIATSPWTVLVLAIWTCWQR